jgi:membrane associated rhomboid family serine protease
VVLPLRDHLPTRTVPFINYALIAANVLVFLGELNGTIGKGLEFVPARLFHDPTAGVETLFTAMFMHAGLAHIGGNMLYLWIFGDNVEDAMGHLRYLAFYLAGGVCAALAQTAADPGSTIPMLGASGAIAAVLAAYVFLYPNSPVTVLNPIPLLWLFWGLFLQVPAWIVIAVFFVVNLWNAFTNTAQGGVAFMAHVGGFVGGALLFRFFMFGRARMGDYERHDRWTRERARPS